ncbi:MAG: NAD(P)/FAD-dependent oxidoreductase [Myxococcota bacterium]
MIGDEIATRAPEAETAVYDAVIIGSGMSGLTSAVILAKQGMRVLVLEQHHRPGGFLHRFSRKGGVSFDVGLHYVGAIERHQIVGRYLDYCGVWDRLDLIPFDPEGYDELRFPDFQFLVPSGEERLIDRLCSTFPRERRLIETYVAQMRTVCDGFGFYNLQPTVDPDHVDAWTSISIGAYLDRLGVSRRLRAVLTAQNPLYGAPPSRAPVALHALVTDSLLKGPYAIRGGGTALAGAMVDRLRELGGELRTRAKVIEIRVGAGGRVEGVVTEAGEVLRAERVISCAHPKATLRMLPDGAIRQGYRDRVLAMEDGCGIVSAYITTSADLSGWATRNVLVYRTDDMESLYEPGDGSHRFAFVTAPSAREGTTRDGRHQAIGLGLLHWDHVRRWETTRTGRRGEAYAELKAAQGSAMRAIMATAMPELATDVASIEVATPLTKRDYTLSERGAAYGIHHVVGQMGRHGLQPRTRVGGLFLTGQSVLLPGVCGVTISAFHTCSEILGAGHLLDDVRRATREVGEKRRPRV